MPKFLPQSLDNNFSQIQQLLFSQYVADYKKGISDLSKQSQSSQSLIKHNQQQNNTAFTQLKQQHQQQLKTLQQQFGKKIKQMNVQHQKKVQQLQQQIQQLEKNTVKRQDLAQIFSDMTHHLQSKPDE